MKNNAQCRRQPDKLNHSPIAMYRIPLYIITTYLKTNPVMVITNWFPDKTKYLTKKLTTISLNFHERTFQRYQGICESFLKKYGPRMFTNQRYHQCGWIVIIRHTLPLERSRMPWLGLYLRASKCTGRINVVHLFSISGCSVNTLNSSGIGSCKSSIVLPSCKSSSGSGFGHNPNETNTHSEFVFEKMSFLAPLAIYRTYMYLCKKSSKMIISIKFTNIYTE